MSIKYPKHLWDCAPQCPYCEIDLHWEDGDEGGGIQKPYAGFWECNDCGKSWGADGPKQSEYEQEKEK